MADGSSVTFWILHNIKERPEELVPLTNRGIIDFEFEAAVLRGNLSQYLNVGLLAANETVLLESKAGDDITSSGGNQY
ncbi:hypothetical protein AcW1_000361 [Taiwanofungus camphoratus]|nr:hypothetical protein AcW1_000361 [Antrodia cinnamomea]